MRTLLLTIYFAVAYIASIVAQPAVALPDSLASMRRIEAVKSLPMATESSESSVESSEQPATKVTPTMDRATAESVWEQANQLYIDNKVEEALEAYLSLYAEGFASAPLFYNTANAYYRTGNIGRAVLFYHRALRLAPSWDDAQHNLEIAERQCKDHIVALPEMFVSRILYAVRDAMSGWWWTALSIATFALGLVFALLFFVGQRNGVRRTGFYGAIASIVLFVVTTAAAASARNVELHRNEAIVVGKSISVKSSPDKAATDIFVLHEGTKVWVDNQIDGWAEVTIANGNKGWTLAKSIERI